MEDFYGIIHLFIINKIINYKIIEQYITNKYKTFLIFHLLKL